LLGDSAAGKSKLLVRFLEDQYNPRQRSTFALNLYRYDTEIDGAKVAVDFWDTAGQERFASMHASYYYKAHACILVFDVTRKTTYTNLTTWCVCSACESAGCAAHAGKWALCAAALLCGHAAAWRLAGGVRAAPALLRHAGTRSCGSIAPPSHVSVSPTRSTWTTR